MCSLRCSIRCPHWDVFRHITYCCTGVSGCLRYDARGRKLQGQVLAYSDSSSSTGGRSTDAQGVLFFDLALVLLGTQVDGAQRVALAFQAVHIGLDRVRSNGYVFQVEMAYVTERLGYSVLEIPIYFEDRRVGQSKMTMPVKIEAALRTFEVRWRHRRLRPSDRLTV